MLEELDESEAPDLERLCRGYRPTMSLVIIRPQYTALLATSGSAMHMLRKKPGIRVCGEAETKTH